MLDVHQQKKRVLAVDALRGFAVMAIILLHNIEHFNFYSFPKDSSPLLASLDSHIWDMLFFMFAGKSYAIFALLFGFTFYLQQRSCLKRGEDFYYRYIWRLFLLLIFGFVNAIFFPGEILVLYALVGLVLIPVRKLKNRTVFWIALVLMLQPLEWCKVICSLICPEFSIQQSYYSLGDVYPQLGGSSFGDMLKANFTVGQLASLNWAWSHGRVFQTASLFMIGMLLGRKGLFVYTSGETGKKITDFWERVAFLSIPIAVFLFYLKDFLYAQVQNVQLKNSLKIIFDSWYNLAGMLIIVSGFLLLYWCNKGRIQKILVPYGRMSLTDYVFQSVIGSFIYFGYGLGLHSVLGITCSLSIGVVFLILQILFAHLWFYYFKRGPLEIIWHRLTWIGRV